MQHGRAQHGAIESKLHQVCKGLHVGLGLGCRGHNGNDAARGGKGCAQLHAKVSAVSIHEHCVEKHEGVGCVHTVRGGAYMLSKLLNGGKGLDLCGRRGRGGLLYKPCTGGNNEDGARLAHQLRHGFLCAGCVCGQRRVRGQMVCTGFGLLLPHRGAHDEEPKTGDHNRCWQQNWGVGAQARCQDAACCGGKPDHASKDPCFPHGLFY
jgi:hypothetical protein